jgi:hypothetical protein
MATKVLLKKSSVPNRVPLDTDLEYGELALNYADGKLYFKNSSNQIEYLGGSLTELGTVTQGTWNADVIQLAYGGTGASTRTGAINNLLPNQNTAEGKYLTTDGTNVSWADIGGGVATSSDASVSNDTFTGDGTTTTFELTVSPPGDQAAIVAINGVVQDPSTYSVASTSLTFSSAPSLNDNIDVRVISVTTTKLSLRDFTKYQYEILAPTTAISGSDLNGLTLEYDPGKLDVYLNGVRLSEGYDYTATDELSVDFTITLGVGDFVEILSYSAAYFLNNPIIADFENLTTTASAQVVDFFDKSRYRTAKYLVQAVDDNNVHCTEVLITHNDTNVYVTEYATMFSSENPLISVTATIDSAYVYLRVTPVNANTTIDFTRVALTARTITSIPEGIEGDLTSQSGTEDLMSGTGSEDLN